VITDTKGNIEYVNPKFTQITGYTKEEALGKNPRILKSGTQPLSFYKNLWETITSGKEWRGEFHNKKKNGEFFWELASISPIRNYEGNITHYLAIKENITERKQIEEDLVKAKEYAENAAKSKSEFLANMSHEIRTPMNAIIGMTNLLMETDLSSEQKEYIDTIDFSADILLNIINDILDFSKIEAGKLNLEKIDFDIYKNIETAVDLVYLSAFKKDIGVYCKICNEIPKMVLGDPLRIRQILLNLVNNAIKFTEKGYIKVEVELIEIYNTKIKLKFSVSDTGVGISKEDMQKLFKPFSQVDASMSRRFGGSGLGLIISKKLVDMMSGDIWVESELGVGSTFYFTLVLERSAPEKEQNKLQNIFKTTNVALIIKDNISRDILAYYLNFLGCNVILFESPDKFDTFNKNSNVDICFIEDHIIDQNSSGYYDILINIKKSGNIKFILLTSKIYLNSKISKKYHNIFIDHLNRPIKRSQIFDIIFNLMNKKESNQKIEREIKTIAIEPYATPNKLRILVAEDNEANQKLIKVLLTKLGHTLDIAIDGEKAVEMATKNNYDIILMDVQMPNMNGYEATIYLRKIGINIPIIAVSANAFKDDIQNSLNIGMNAHITKPYKKEEIIEVLNKFSKKEFSPKETNNSEDFFDYNELLNNFENEKELVLDVLAVFNKKVGNQIKLIENAITNKDFEKIKFEAHSIKGSSLNITAKKLGLTAEKIERNAKEKRIDEIIKNFETLKEDYENLNNTIEILLE
ncbi:MAG TPA: ATP-binding protein, partial [Spirochaetota bacterium]|nr:ATP-binding protein [Spirochaetota bacterium]